MPISFTATAEAPADADVLAVPAGPGPELVGPAVAEVDVAHLTAMGFEGKVGQTASLLADDGGLVVVYGVGPADRFDGDAARRAAAAVAGAAKRARTVALVLPPGGSLSVEQVTQAVVEGAILGSYRFDTYKRDATPIAIEEVTVVGGAAGAVQRAEVVAAAVCLARDLINEPAGAVTPTRLAEVAEELAAGGQLEVSVMDEVTIEAEGLGCLLGVSMGSEEPPRLIQLTYRPKGRSKGTLALVGKGITFDSGGLSLKSADGMMTMKTDMSGGAAVLAAMSALPALKPDVTVIGLVAATENMPGRRAIKPGDVLKARNGRTVEVLNTDAEGRLVLADALSIAVEQAPDAIVDLATLTGAQVVALGKSIAAVLGNDQGLLDQVRVASERAGEPTWPLPLPASYRSHLDSEVADLKNIGNPGQAGTVIAGLFLEEFVDGVPWAHLDIAGPARADKDDGHLTRGGTGFGVRTLLELVGSFRPPRAGG